MIISIVYVLSKVEIKLESSQHKNDIIYYLVLFNSSNGITIFNNFFLLLHIILLK